ERTGNVVAGADRDQGNRDGPPGQCGEISEGRGMSMDTKSEIANEVKMFWRLAQDMRQAEARGECLSDMLDELDVLRDHTNHAPLKDQCEKLMLIYAARMAAEDTGQRVG